MRWRSLIALGLVCGVNVYCASNSDTNQDEDDDGVGTGGSGASVGTGGSGAGEVSCNGVGFAAEASTWTLPDYGVDINGDKLFQQVADAHTCPDTGILRYQVANLDGADGVDLVVTENCAADTQTGDTQWRVHNNTGSGFAAEATSWTLPDYGVDINGEPLFRALADAHTCPDAGILRYQVLDLNGDGQVDLVVSDNCNADTATGASQWRVHNNTGSGFAAEASTWTLPSYGVDINGEPLFEQVAGAHTCPDAGIVRYQLVDLSGDGKVELVVSQNCAADTVTGSTQWLVHENTGTGFAAQATPWTLPSYGVDINGEPLFEQIADAHTCPDTGVMRYQLLDLTGDRKPDLVVTDNCTTDTSTGAQQWLVHENTGGGFAAQATVWTLPSYGVDINGEPMFESVADSHTCPDTGVMRYQVLDLAGDHRPDLVVSSNCTTDTQTGSSQWRVHTNEGSGFAAEPMTWSIPSYGVDINGEPLYRNVSNASTCPDTGVMRFQLLELSGDNKADFLVSDNCAADAATGASQWRLHPTECE